MNNPASSLRLRAKYSGEKLITDLRLLPWRERWLLLFSLPIMVATIFCEQNLFKLGIALPLRNDPSAGVDLKIYLFELYLLASAALLGPAAFRNFPSMVKKGLPIIYSLTLGLLIFGMLRLALETPAAPVLAIRNSAFLWYLFLPLLFATAKTSERFFEIFAALAINSAFVVFTLTVIACAFTFPSDMGSLIFWMPQVGLYSIFWWQDKKNPWKTFLAAVLGVGIAYGMQFHFQRTSLVGLVVAFGFLASQRKYRPAALRTLFIALLFCGLSLGIIVGQKKLSPPAQAATVASTDSNPFVKAQSNEHGLEIFRWSMWRDAVGLFRERPWVGIGFERQVVFRVFKGHGIYVPNDTNWWKPIGRALLDPGSAPPIAGPHNSYLNALARIGIAGALFAIIHVLSFFLLWRHGHHYSAFLVFAQSLYAFFNVGLEGPVRSALLLISMGLALQLCWSSGSRTAQRHPN